MVVPLSVSARWRNRWALPVVISASSPYFSPTSDPDIVHPLLLLAALQDPSGSVPQAPPPTARIPRIEAEVSVDGRLDEPVWVQAAVLSGFRQYQPVDGRPAEQEAVGRARVSPRGVHCGSVASDR